MNKTKQLQDLGQSLWLDNIPRETLDDGTLRRYIDELSVSGLTSNPTIVDEAIRKTCGDCRGLAAQLGAGDPVLRLSAGGA